MARSVRGHQLGSGSPHVLLRVARCLEGTVELEVVCPPSGIRRLSVALTVVALQGNTEPRPELMPQSGEQLETSVSLGIPKS